MHGHLCSGMHCDGRGFVVHRKRDTPQREVVDDDIQVRKGKVRRRLPTACHILCLLAVGLLL